MSCIIDNNFLQNFSNELANFPYRYIYISFGSKLNCKYIELMGRKKKSNANIQILPKFLKETDQLIIMVDYLTTNDSKEDHLKFINDELLQCNNCKCIILNTYADENFINGVFDILLPKLIEHHINSNNLIIVNFIKFLNTPNESEKASALIVSKTIYYYLEKFKEAIYLDCYYEWFGYRKVLYNYIYNFHALKSQQVTIQHLYEIETILQYLTNSSINNVMVIQNQDISSILNIIIPLHIRKQTHNNFNESIYKFHVNMKRLVDV